MKPVVIVGAGLSGLSAGVALASRHIPVLLLEQRPYAGGRAYSFRDRTTGDVIDNGQHLLIAGYGRTRAYLETIGSTHLLHIQKTPALVFHHPRRGFVHLRLPALPSPLHMLAGVLGSDLFTVADKLGVLRAGHAIARGPADGSGVPERWTIEHWLDRVGASRESRFSFWHPLAVSIMNERAEAASARVFVRALREAFLSHPGSAALAMPTVGLSELLVDPAVSYIRSHGGEVRLGADVTEIIEGGENVTGVRVRDGVVVEASGVVLAVASTHVARLVPPACASSVHVGQGASTAVSPILCIHLWYDRPVSTHPVIGVLGRRVQWVFRHTRMRATEARHAHPEEEVAVQGSMETGDPGSGERLSLVISAAYEEAGWTNEALIETAIADCVALFGARAQGPSHALVIREKRATFSLSPSIEPLRPGPRTPLHNLFLAGDWTATGLPATVEGAIRSGESAAAFAARLAAP